MATINNLNRSISELSDAEVYELIKRRRFQRRIEKVKPKKVAKRKAAKRKPKPKLSPTQLAKMLTPEQKTALAKLLLGGN